MFRRHISTILVAMVTAAVTAAAPSLAAAFDALNSDKVDGKHAVGAKASVTKRKNKLVATNKKGKLPNNIIAKAPNAVKADSATTAADADDSEKLDGLDSSAFMKGSGSQYYTGTREVATDAAAGTIMTLPGLTLQGTCVSDVTDVVLNLDADWSEAYTLSNGAGAVIQDPTAASINVSASDPGHWVFHLAWRGFLGSSRVTTIEVFGQEGGAGDCKYSATAIDRGTGGLVIGPIFPTI